MNKRFPQLAGLTLLLFSYCLLFLGGASVAQANQVSKNQESQNPDFKRAMRLFSQHDYNGSRALLRQLVRRYPNSGLYWYNLANDDFELKEYRLAANSYNHVIHLRSPLTPLAWFGLAQSERHLGNNHLAMRILNRLSREHLPVYLLEAVKKEMVEIKMESAPSNTDKNFAEGMKLYKSGHYHQALRYFDVSLKKKPGAQAATMKGLTLLHIGKPEHARVAFQRVTQLPASPELRSDAVYFLNQIHSHLWRRRLPYWAFLNMGLGYNSDLYDNGWSEMMKAAPTQLISAGAGYHFLMDHPTSVELAYNFWWQGVSNIPSDDVLAHNIRVPVLIHRGPWLATITPGFQIEDLSSQPFLTVPSLTLQAERKIQRIKLGMAYSHSVNHAQNSSYDYLNGPVDSGRIYLNFNTKKMTFDFSLNDWTENTGDLPYNTGTLPLANTSFGPAMSVSWYPNWRWESETVGAYYWRDFFSLAQPGNKKRKDTEKYLAETVSYRWNPKWRAYLSEQIVFNSSTLGAGDVADRNFDKYVTLAGVVWDIAR